MLKGASDQSSPPTTGWSCVSRVVVAEERRRLRTWDVGEVLSEVMSETERVRERESKGGMGGEGGGVSQSVAVCVSK